MNSVLFTFVTPEENVKPQHVKHVHDGDVSLEMEVWRWKRIGTEPEKAMEVHEKVMEMVQSWDQV